VIAADDVVTRPQRDGEWSAVRELVAAAFGDVTVADLVDALQADEAGRKGASIVAAMKDRIVGHVQLSRSWLDTPTRLIEVLVLSPLAVAPDVQGQGIGGSLVRAALQAADDLESPLLFLEGSPRYYPRFGFVAGGTLGFIRPSVRIPEAAFQVVRLTAWEAWMTGQLVYSEIFWRHDAVGLRDRPGDSTSSPTSSP
jgi:putative acetyltransferase